MFSITVKNMLKDKMVTLSLIIGFILSAAVVSSVPIYTRGIMNRLLKNSFIENKTGSMKNTDGTNNGYVYPASFLAEYDVDVNTSYQKFLKDYNDKNKFIDEFINDVKAPVLAHKIILSMQNIEFLYTDAQGQVKSAYDEITSVSDAEKHIKIVKGTKPSESIGNDKTVDVLVDEDTFQNYCMSVGKIYETNDRHGDSCIKLKIAGVFKIDSSDPYWQDKDTDFYTKLLVTQNEFFNILKKDNYYMHDIQKVRHEIMYDYKNFDYGSIDGIYSKLVSKMDIMKNGKAIDVKCPIISYLKNFIEDKNKYITLIWIFTAPILIIILIYVYMISGFVVDSDKEQIAVLKSRGASLSEILRIYLYEGLLICGVGILLGPLIGLLICRLLGYVVGFLDFDIGMKPMSFVLDSKAYLYSAAIAAVSMLTLMVSVYFASKSTIVELKHSKKKYLKTIFNVKNLDIIFLLISFYGYFVYSKYKNVSMFSQSGDVPIDPLLYMLSAIFVIGFGMFLLRVYKYLIKLIQVISSKFKSVPFYLAVINVLRYHMDKSIIMLFIIITVSIGIFNIVISKKINLSSEHTVSYLTGADMTVKQNWSYKEDTTYLTGGDSNSSKLYIYNEPPYMEFSKIKGISGCTRVLNTTKGQVSLTANSHVECSVMGIIPHEFGRIAWFDSSLLKYHWYYYLNAMTTYPDYVLISSGLSKKMGIKKGDTIYYNIESGLNVSGTVMDIIDYWPGCSDMKKNCEVIGNFNYIYSKIPKYPYEIWIKKDRNISDKIIYNSINDLKLSIGSYKDMSQEIYNERNDIFLKGTNAVLSLGLISAATVTIAGFMLYWMKSLKNRKMVFGVYRSLGISAKKVSLVIAIEQLFTLGASIILGIIAGNTACSLFVPLIEGMWNNGKFTVPVKNISYLSEYLSFGGIMIVIFAIMLLILIRNIKKLNINEAIKMGEE